MKRLAPAVLLLAVSCAAPRPREEADLLFSSAEERARRDVVVVYRNDSTYGDLSLLVMTRDGRVECRLEPGSPMSRAMMTRLGMRTRWEGTPPTADQKQAIDRFFAALPPGEPAWSFPPRKPPRGKDFQPEVESADRKIRILHVAPDGRVRIVTLHKPWQAGPVGVPPPDAAVVRLDELFVELARPR